MREYGLIGYPLSHSFSQKYFTEKFEKEGIADSVFHAFSIPSYSATTTGFTGTCIDWFLHYYSL